MKTAAVVIPVLLALANYAQATAIILSDNRSVSYEVTISDPVAGGFSTFSDSQQASARAPFAATSEKKAGTLAASALQKSAADGELFEADQTAAANFSVVTLLPELFVGIKATALYDVTFRLDQAHAFELTWDLPTERARLTAGTALIWDGALNPGGGRIEGTLPEGTYRLLSETSVDVSGTASYSHPASGADSKRSQFSLALRVPDGGSVAPLAGLAMLGMVGLSRRLTRPTGLAK